MVIFHSYVSLPEGISLVLGFPMATIFHDIMSHPEKIDATFMFFFPCLVDVLLLPSMGIPGSNRWRYVSTIFLAIFCGDFLTLHSPKKYAFFLW